MRTAAWPSACDEPVSPSPCQHTSPRGETTPPVMSTQTYTHTHITSIISGHEFHYSPKLDTGDEATTSKATSLKLGNAQEQKSTNSQNYISISLEIALIKKKKKKKKKKK